MTRAAGRGIRPLWSIRARGRGAPTGASASCAGNQGVRSEGSASVPVEEGALGHVVRGQDLQEELRGGCGDAGQLLLRGVPEHVEEDLVMDPREVEHADPGGDGGAPELVAAGQRSLVAA